MKKIILYLLYFVLYTPFILNMEIANAMESGEDDEYYQREIRLIQRDYAKLRIAANTILLEKQNRTIKILLERAQRLQDAKWTKLLTDHLAMNKIQANHFIQKDGKTVLNMQSFQQELENKGLLEKLEDCQ